MNIISQTKNFGYFFDDYVGSLGKFDMGTHHLVGADFAISNFQLVLSLADNA